MVSLNKQRGFTLVEIAIVLIIIGLLLGGILQGQALIASARVRNIADQNSGVQAAYYGFIDRYRQVPGDWNAVNAAQAIPGVTAGGNDSGGLDPVGGSSWTEPLALWHQLALSGFIQGNYIGGNAAPNAADVDRAPRNAFNGFLVMYQSDDYAGAAASTRLNLVLGAGIPVDILRELDLKVDDGLPETGVLRHALAAGAELGAPAQSTANCTAAGPPAIWNIAGNEQLCNAVYLY